MTKVLVSLLTISISTVVTYNYYNYFGFNIKSIIVFFVIIEYIKMFINWKKDGEAK